MNVVIEVNAAEEEKKELWVREENRGKGNIIRREDQGKEHIHVERKKDKERNEKKKTEGR